MSERGSVYLATSLHNSARAQALIRKLSGLGINITYDWTQHGQVHTEEELLAYGLAEERGVQQADLLLFVTPARNGSHIEFGIARALGKPIVMLMEEPTELKTFYFLPGVVRCSTEDEAMVCISTIMDRIHHERNL